MALLMKNGTVEAFHNVPEYQMGVQYYIIWNSAARWKIWLESTETAAAATMLG